MRSFTFALGVATAMVPMIAEAHGPTRQKITVTQEVAAAPDKVWARIGKAEDGPTISEVLYKYKNDKRTYSYRITEVDVAVLPVTNYSSHLTVKEGKDGGSLVEWRGAFYRGYPNNDPPENLNDAAAIAAVTGVYEAGLKALAEEFAETQ